MPSVFDVRYNSLSKNKLKILIDIISKKKMVVSRRGCHVIGNRGHYSVTKYQGIYYSTHRLIYLYHNGKINNKMQVCHKCDNPSCINPEHLFQGTPTDNFNDSRNKGRSIYGERCGSSKLTEKDVIKILKDNRPSTIIAKEYNVCKSTISHIKVGRNWKHLTGRRG